MDPIEHAHDLLDLNDSVAAEATLRAHLLEAPTDHEALGLLAVALRAQDRDAEAEEEMEKALALAPAGQRAALLLDGAEIALSLRHSQTAADRLIEAIESGALEESELYNASAALAEAYLQSGNAQAAREAILVALTLQHHGLPQDQACVHEMHGDALHRLGAFGAADAAYAIAYDLSSDPATRVRARLGRARLADETDDMSSALAHCAAAMQDAGDDEELRGEVDALLDDFGVELPALQ